MFPGQCRRLCHERIRKPLFRVNEKSGREQNLIDRKNCFMLKKTSMNRKTVKMAQAWWWRHSFWV